MSSTKKPILAVDVDQCCVDSATPWWRDLELMTKLGKTYDEVKHLYNFKQIYQEELHRRGLGNYDWWKSENIYDDLEPIEGCVDTLQWASEHFRLRFVSVIRGGHGGSKSDWLKRYFPFMEAHGWTKEKWMCQMDVLIDDRNENLRDCTNEYPELITIRYPTPHEQYVDFSPNFICDWSQMRFILEAIL